MDRVTQLNYYIVNTRRGRLSDRSEVEEGLLRVIRPIVQAGGGELPGGLRVEITRHASGGHVLTVYRGDATVATCGLAVDDTQASQMWPQLTNLAQLLGFRRPKRQPPTPWLSVLILPGLAQVDPGPAGMLGELERCLAWAILESVK
jgi:hypothetical protein